MRPKFVSLFWVALSLLVIRRINIHVFRFYILLTLCFVIVQIKLKLTFISLCELNAVVACVHLCLFNEKIQGNFYGIHSNIRGLEPLLCDSIKIDHIFNNCPIHCLYGKYYHLLFFRVSKFSIIKFNPIYLLKNKKYFH